MHMSGLGFGDGNELACFRVGARRAREREVHPADKAPEFVVRARERARIDLRTQQVALAEGAPPIVERELVKVRDVSRGS